MLIMYSNTYMRALQGNFANYIGPNFIMEYILGSSSVFQGVFQHRELAC